MSFNLLEGFQASLYLKKGNKEFKFGSANDLLRKAEKLGKDEILRLNLRLECSEAANSNGGNALTSEFRKVFESRKIDALSDLVGIQLDHWRNFDITVAVDLKREVNRIIKTGFNFRSLKVNYFVGAEMSTDEVDELVQGLDSKRGPNLPPLSLTITTSAGVTLLARCLRIGWPLEAVKFESFDFENSEFDWRSIRHMLKGSKFEIILSKYEEGRIGAHLNPIVEAVSVAEGDIKFHFFGGIESGIVYQLLDQRLPRWSKMRNEQVISLEIDSTNSGKHSISLKGTKCAVKLPDPNEFLTYLSNFYRAAGVGSRLRQIEQIRIIVRRDLEYILPSFIKAIASQNHSLISFSTVVEGRQRETPRELCEQIQLNLSRKMQIWISSGVKVNYGRLKLMMIGKQRAGKSSTIRSLLGKKFKEDIKSTLVAQTDTDVSIAVQDVSSTWKQKNLEGNWVMEEMGEYLCKLKDMVDSGKHEVLVGQNETQLRAKGDHEKKPSVVLHNLEKSILENVSTQLDRSLQRQRENEFNQPDGRDDTRLTIWDFGGQEVFYAIHHLYLTSGGIYLLVFDLTLMITEKESEMEYIDFWLTSVSLHASDASVIMVGTRCSEVSEEALRETAEELYLAVDNKDVNLLEPEPENGLNFFPIDNSKSDTIEGHIKPLKSKIFECFHRDEIENKDSNMNQKLVPLSWIYLMNNVIKGFKEIITIEQLTQIATDLNLEVKRDITPMLEFYKNAGGIISFIKANKGAKLSGYVVISPDWLLKAIGSFIYDKNEHKKLRKHRKLRTLIDEYELKGILSNNLLHQFLQEANIVQKEYIEFIIQLCQDMLLIANFDFVPKWSNVENDSFHIVPCMNHQIADEECILDEYATTDECLNIFMHFNRKVPTGLFERVVCATLTCNMRYDGAILEPTIMKNFCLFFFRNVEVFLIDEHENGDYRFSIKKTDGKKLNVVINLIEIISQIEKSLSTDALGKKMMPSIELKTQDQRGKLLRCRYSDLSKAMEKNDENVTIFLPDGRHRLREVSLFPHFAEALKLKMNRERVASTSPRPSSLSIEYQCFLAHTWGPENRTHNTVVEIGKELKKSGLRVWIDEDNLKKHISIETMRGIRKSACVLVFITERYFKRIDDPDSNAAKEFINATRKGVKYLIPVVLEPRYLDPRTWIESSAAYNLQDAMFVDFSTETRIKENFSTLVEMIWQLNP